MSRRMPTRKIRQMSSMLKGNLYLPGLIDIHSHGAVGCDFSDGDKGGVKKILAYERAHGITTYCPPP